MLNQETAKAARTDSGYILRAPRRMRVADAVAQYMRVPMGAGNSVPWDPLVAPYVIEPMNCLASREYDAVIFVGPARTGKTIGLIDGWVIYNVICDPADMLIIQMTEEKAREHSKKRLARTFRVSPEVVSRLSPNKNDNNVYDRTFLAGNYLKIGWPSVNIMSSSDYKCVALTDYDRFPEDIDGEGDAFSLASKRTTTFMSSGMTLVESSPGRDVKDVKWRRTSPHEAPPTTGILSLYNRGDRRRWYWPCPHCGEYFQPCGDVVAGFRDIADPVLASEAAYIQCPSCSGRILPEQKRELNGRGVWLLAEQKARVNGINDLFAMFGGRYQTLQAQCLADPECSLEQAREKLLNEMGRESTPSNKNTPAHIYAGNGNFVGDGIRQALMARAGFEKTERDNVYNGMTLREYARMSLTERGIGVSSYNPMQMVGAAFTHSTSDFGNILLDVANKAILQGWEDAPETYEQWTRKGQLGAEGLRHVPGDVIEICDDDYAGISTGGRVLAVNSQTRTLTLDREITLPSSGTTLISLVDGEGNPVSVEVQSVTDGVKVKVSRVPDGVAEYSVWGLKLPTLRQRLFRCVSIRENDDGTYAITAVQHVPEKEAIVDNGAHFDGDQSGTVNGVTPPAVQHLTAEVTADSGEYQVLARWDTPKVVKGVSFMLRLTVAADDGSERLVSTVRTTETTYRFRQLALGRYTLTVRAVNAWGQQGDPASVSFRIAAPAAPSRIELTPGYFQITATPHLAVYDPTVQFEFWFSETRITDIRQVETTARYLGTGLYWIAASINIKPGHDYYFYIRSVNTVGKSAFVESVGRASDDAEGYLDFFKGKITESHLGKELLEKVDLTEDNASRLDEFSKEWKDANDKWNAMWAVKIEQTKDGKHYVAGIGLSMEDTEEGKLSQFLVAANRIAFIDPANGNETPMFVAQGNQIFMNDVFLKRLTAPTITSGGNPPAFSLTPDGRLTAKNADISGNVNANSGTLNNVTINENCRVLGKLSANQIEGDLVKTVGKAFPRDSRAPERWPSGTITVRVYDDQPFDRQIVIPAVAFSGAKHEREHTDIYSSCRLIVRKNGAEIYNRTALDNTLIYSGVIDMPAGHGHMTLEFSVSAWLVNDWYPTASISDLLVVVMKKATAGISIS
ncbi:DUF1983 domain-containing protein [Escherichia coli]|uniref:phage tail tip domain-containing protein n=25 Tax=Escherichia coli TaxID=562 RepID=UPI000FBBDE27|nr:phage terminase large subunit family protein [Escherichia coli]MFA78986.1 DUF1983 domain-containing protein [Escherichia coli]GDH79793.1 phage host specificity protein [Escherichia coli]